MTDIKWGPAIAVDGKRPGMIVDGEPIKLFVSYALGGDRETVAKQQISWPHIDAIALPADHPHYRQTEEAPIDWSGELEAVHEDGRAVAVKLRPAEAYGNRNPDEDGQYWADAGGDVGRSIWNADGSGANARALGWRIRNVPQPTPQADTKPDLMADDMEKLVRDLAASDTRGCFAVRARAIVALLPEPVDPDEAEVDRLMCLDLPTRVIVEAALARGRELALAGETGK